jgi:hypothetical protein
MDDRETLLDLLSKQIADAGLAEEVNQLVLAAYSGDHQLRAVLDGGSFDLGAGTGCPDVRPAALYLKSLQVTGFRGVGQAPPLRLSPGAGLTLVVGRIGSGKSSFGPTTPGPLCRGPVITTATNARSARRNSIPFEPKCTPW